MARHSATLAINERLRARREAGREVLHLGFGEAGLPVLDQVGDVLAGAVQRTSYAPVAGTAPARAAAAGYFTRRGLPTDPDQIVLAPGSKPLLFALLAAVPGDLVLPRPSWVSYAAQAALIDKNVIDVPIPLEAGGVPDPDRLETALAEANARGQHPTVLILTLPDNPTGTMPSPEMIERVCGIARRHELLVLSDEIYRDLAMPPDFRGPADLLGQHTVVTSGLSKNMALGGYRIGFARLPDLAVPGRLYEELTGIASEVWSSLAGPMHQVATWVLDEPPEVTAHIDTCRALHHTVNRAVRDVFLDAGATCRPEGGAFYLYPDLENFRPVLRRRGISTNGQLAEHLLEHYGVGVLAGTEFGDVDTGLRFRVATSMLYGATDEQRWETLRSRDPLSLPWISASLLRLREVLEDLHSPTPHP